MAGEPPEAFDREIEVLVAQCIARIEQEGSSALEAFCREHAHHADALRRRISSLHRAGLIEVAVPKEPFPERLGEFRLLSPLGGGGMGVVYLAMQEPLGRTVALKLIRPENLYFPGARERFQREIEAVARLQHPGIVPVYTVGEENGVPFFAMEHVDGKSLSQCIAELKPYPPDSLGAVDLKQVLGGRDDTKSAEGKSGSAPKTSRASGASGAKSPSGSGPSGRAGESARSSGGAPASGTVRETKASASTSSVLRGRWVEVCLRTIREVALALHHAHERGVLHRDVKPSNVMLTRDGRVLLLDFGLAVSQDATKLTRSGTLVGSLPYMAPEQVQGRAAEVGPKTDVYGLGVTFYEMLTLHLPYSNTIADELQRAIVDGRPDPPSRRNSAIPWDAETVCLTAMDPDPARRYESADAFARDLSNVLDLRPIEAKRPGAVLRVRRFTQRHPALAVGSVLGLLIAIGGPTAFALLERSRRVEVLALNAKLESALSETEAQRARAERNLARAMTAVDSMLSEVGGRELADVPLMGGVRQRLLERALELNRGFAAEEGDDPDVSRRVADGNDNMGRILALLGRNEEARAQFHEAADRRAELLRASPGGIDELELARARLEIATLHLEGGDLPAAEKEIEAAKPPLEKRIARGVDAEATGELARVLELGSRIASARGDVKAAEKLLHDALDLCDESTNDATATLRHATWWKSLGLLLMQQPSSYPSRATEIEQAFEESLAAFERLDPADRAHPDSRILRAVALQDLAGHFRRLERWDEAATRYHEARTELESLVAGYPERVSARMELATVLNNLGLVAELTKKNDEAERYYQQAVDRLAELHRAVPGVADLVSNLGSAWMNLAITANHRGDRALESARLEHARDALGEALKLNPENADYRAVLFNALGGLVLSKLSQGLHADAAAAAIAAQAARPDSPNHAMKGAIYLARCAKVAGGDPELDESQRAAAREEYAAKACEFIRRAITLGMKDTASLATAEDFASIRETAAFRALLESVEASGR